MKHLGYLAVIGCDTLVMVVFNLLIKEGSELGEVVSLPGGLVLPNHLDCELGYLCGFKDSVRENIPESSYHRQLCTSISTADRGAHPTSSYIRCYDDVIQFAMMMLPLCYDFRPLFLPCNPTLFPAQIRPLSQRESDPVPDSTPTPFPT